MDVRLQRVKKRLLEISHTLSPGYVEERDVCKFCGEVNTYGRPVAQARSLMEQLATINSCRCLPVVWDTWILGGGWTCHSCEDFRMASRYVFDHLTRIMPPIERDDLAALRLELEKVPALDEGAENEKHD